MKLTFCINLPPYDWSLLQLRTKSSRNLSTSAIKFTKHDANSSFLPFWEVKEQEFF